MRDMTAEKLNVCSFCKGYGRHTCTFLTCEDAVEKARKFYRKEREKNRMAAFKDGSDKEHYSKTVMEALHEVLQVDLDEDIDSIRRLYSLDEILDAVLAYEGILGYTDKLVHIIADIFQVNLRELDV